jgi:hypothetical protein
MRHPSVCVGGMGDAAGGATDRALGVPRTRPIVTTYVNHRVNPRLHPAVAWGQAALETVPVVTAVAGLTGNGAGNIIADALISVGAAYAAYHTMSRLAGMGVSKLKDEIADEETTLARIRRVPLAYHETEHRMQLVDRSGPRALGWYTARLEEGERALGCPAPTIVRFLATGPNVPASWRLGLNTLGELMYALDMRARGRDSVYDECLFCGYKMDGRPLHGPRCVWMCAEMLSRSGQISSHMTHESCYAAAVSHGFKNCICGLKVGAGAPTFVSTKLHLRL